MSPDTYLPSNPTASQIEACPDLPADFFKSHQQSNTPYSTTSSEPRRSSSSINPSLSLPRRGAYLPFAILENPQPIKAFRFVYPYLLLGSPMMEQAFIWDVPHAKLLQTVDVPPPPPPAYFQDEDDVQLFNYVELSNEFIFVCWTAGLRVYRWKVTGPGQTIGEVVFEYPPTERSDGIALLYKVWGWDSRRVTNNRPLGETARVPYRTQDVRWTKAEKIECMPLAVHISPDGKDLVVLVNETHLLYVPDFILAAHKQALGTPTKREIEQKLFKLPDSFMVVTDWDCSYLAFDGKRAVVSTVRQPTYLWSIANYVADIS